MRREVEWAQTHPEIEDWVLDRQAFAEASEGQAETMQSACRDTPSHWRSKGVNASKRPSSR